MSFFNIETFCTHCLYSHIYISLSSYHKQLNGDLKSITFVVLAVHGNMALVSSFQSETGLLLYVHEQFAMSLDLLCFTILYIRLLLFENNSAVKISFFNIQTFCIHYIYSHIKDSQKQLQLFSIAVIAICQVILIENKASNFL